MLPWTWCFGDLSIGTDIDHLQDYLLPRSLTLRLAKSVLPPNTTVQKDAVLAMQKAATVFVSYLSSQYVYHRDPLHLRGFTLISGLSVEYQGHAPR